MSHIPDIFTAVRHSDRVLCEQISAWEPLDFGIAHCSASFPALSGANQLRDAWLADTDPQTAFDLTEQYFAVRGLACLAWTPASGQPVEPVESLLLEKSWRRFDRTALHLDLRSSTIDALLAESRPNVRILPARSMPKAHQASYLPDNPADQILFAAARERLNDSRYDLSIALIDGQPAGRCAYLEAGDIARLTDLFVVPAFRNRGIARALIAHFLQTARRLLPKTIVAAAPPDDAPAHSCLSRAGFTPSGTLTEFHRPT